MAGLEQFGRMNVTAFVRSLIDAGVAITPNNGTPIDGVSGKGFAGKGSLLIDFTTGALYSNVGDEETPTWSIHGAATNLNGDDVAPITDTSIVGGIQLCRKITFSGNGTISITLPADEMVVDAWIIISSNNISGLVDVEKNSGTSITVNGMDTNFNSGEISRAGEINLANSIVPQGQTLDVVTQGSNPSGICFIETIKV